MMISIIKKKKKKKKKKRRKKTNRKNKKKKENYIFNNMISISYSTKKQIKKGENSQTIRKKI